jgi:hypothetical protein
MMRLIDLFRALFPSRVLDVDVRAASGTQTHSHMSAGEQVKSEVKLDDPLLMKLLAIPNICIAGGFVILNEVPWLKNTESSDVDFWAYGMTNAIRQKAATAMVDVLREHDKDMCAHVIGSSVITFYLSNYERPLQLILVEANSPFEIIERFDIAACRAFYAIDTTDSQQRVILGRTAATIAEWESKTIHSNPIMEIRNCRLRKLYQRGFRIDVTGYETPSDEEMHAYENRNKPCERRQGAAECSLMKSELKASIKTMPAFGKQQWKDKRADYDYDSCFSR